MASARSGPVLIAGAGIGGLTAAACLLQAGIDVEVYEQAPVLSEVGAGIQISANAGRVYRHLGLMDAVRAAGAEPALYRFRMFDTGEVLQTIPLGSGYEARHGVPYVTIHRADLHALLVERVRALKPDAIRLGVGVSGYATNGREAELLTSRGPVRGAAVIGADGIRSVIRAQMLGDTLAEYTGDCVWRAMVQTPDLPPEHQSNCVDIWVGPHRHAVTYPLRGGALTNFVGCVEYDGVPEDGWTIARPWAEMQADFAGWHPMIGALIHHAARDACYRWSLRIRPPVQSWTDGRVTLLGDAAHPTLPYMAQGAAMAVEDAVILARCLASTDVARALSAYQHARLARTTRIVTESTANRALFHQPDRDRLQAAFAARDMNAERSAWLFSYDPVTEGIQTG
ncbi:MAG: FAD-dependent monooxygenase [Gemmobacter sp.]|nr:FAD-dependent monooxygenase [Gemmobacter sp.]